MDKKILLSWNNTVYYQDGTYRCDFWDEGIFSEWKIVDGKFCHRHNRDGENDWVLNSDREKDRLVRWLKEAIDKVFEKEVLE